MTKRRVIFPPADYWTQRKEHPMSDLDDHHLDDDDMLIYRGQLQAIELCRAVSANAGLAADEMFAAEADAGVLKHLVAGLVHAAVSLARTVEQHLPGVTEDHIWAVLSERSTTGLIATHEINEITGGDTA